MLFPIDPPRYQQLTHELMTEGKWTKNCPLLGKLLTHFNNLQPSLDPVSYFSANLQPNC